MISLKKLYGDELLRLALVLSLLKVDPNDYLERETQQMLAGLHISNGSDWSLEQEARTLIRPRFVHPKSLDNILINYERQLFEELNSLGRYGNSDLEYNDRIWNNRAPILHTYLVNNVATDTVAPALAAATVAENADQDSVSADENVAQEVKVSDEEEETTNNEVQEHPDAIVTLSPGHNRTQEDIFAEIASRSFDVNELLVHPSEMQIKQEEEDYEVRVKQEEDDDLYSDNAIDFMPYFNPKNEMDLGDTNSVFQQNMADLQEFGEIDEAKELKNDLEYLDVKQQQENLEQYLMENTPLDSEVYELAPMFEEELVLNVKRERASTSFTASSSGVSDMEASSDGVDVKIEPDEGHHTGDELTQEDMDLIEVLWKQDVDMGFSLEDPVQPEGPTATKVLGDEIEKELKLAEEKIVKKNEEKAEIEKVKASLLDPEIKEDDPWAGLSYTVDTETGEYVIQGDLPRELVSSEESRFDLLEEALGLVELGDEADTKNEPPEAIEGSSSGTGSEMLHPAMRHVPHHPLAHYHNQSLMRSMSVEQRWQDLASLLTIPPPPPPEQYQHYHPHHHQHHPHNISSHGAAAGYGPNYHASIPPVPEKHPEAYGGAAAPLEGAYKVEAAQHPQQHDPLYYQNASAEMTGPTNQDGFLQSILNDEDLQLMDMAMNEGMYTMRMLDGAGPHHAPHHTHSHMMMTERDSASDSAVSSMGSERVPSLSDGEWCDGSDSAQEFHSSKFRPYDSSFGRERSNPHQPQKKHHMFGKRCFQEQPAPTLDPVGRPSVVKYECPEQTYHHENMHMHNVEFAPRPQLAPPHVTNLHAPALDLNTAHSSHALLQSNIPSPAPPRFAYATPERVRHNHTYSAPLANDQRPAAVRDKRVRRLTDGSMSDGGSSATSSGQHLSRDEKRAKALVTAGIPLEVQDIINLPMDEFNERLSKHDLSEAQLSLIRDIRRRGKNKVAAQNCRKRKLDQITSLADEVRTVRDRKQRTQRDHSNLLAERQRVKERFAALYRHVFQNLRDPEGRPLSSQQYSLQQAADGNVVLVPKMPQHQDHPMNRTSDDDLDRKAKSYDQ
nr:segmentation protein cap'n'collar isoform X1 [Helicoverpa armigera]XP_049695663.1 segmentation protein cap'n'collar isoform X1 [Helicoverpa armigera]XP_049695664.1 segmentation protein cap'n'collar isoform X1 [Helicoverpa armigera]XP_049695665.1 segmentation protein cap'n'collar isoform X1 [Helicoverpa armigera]